MTEPQRNEEHQAPSVPAKPAPKLVMKGLYPPGGPKIVRQEYERLGFQWVPPNTPNASCTAIWTMRCEPDDLKALQPLQKVNFFPAMPELCWKDKLHFNMEEAKAKFGDDYSFWPDGYVLPQQWEQFSRFYETAGIPTPIILKPSRNAMGNGIKCITSIDQVELSDDYVQKQIPLAQHYIMDPLLLDGYKISFRIYVLVTSFNPLRIYVYPNGLTRICSKRYNTDPESFADLYTHLTNVDINKHNIDEFVNNKSAELDTDGLRSDINYVFDKLGKDGFNVEQIWEDIKDSIVKSCLAVEHKIGGFVSRLVPWRCNSFEILGYDYILDTRGKPWLLEINHAPNLEPHTELETSIKRGMIRDSLQIVDVLSEFNAFLNKETARVWAIVQNNPSVKLSDLTLSDLTRGDVYTIIATELEYKRRGDYQRLYPNPDSAKYFKYMHEGSFSKKIVSFLALGRSYVDFFAEIEPTQ